VLGDHAPAAGARDQKKGLVHGTSPFPLCRQAAWVYFGIVMVSWFDIALVLPELLLTMIQYV
jgi:hypothetical protein